MNENFDKLIKAIENTNSTTEQHREQHKCLWDNIKGNSQKLNIIDDELHSNIPTKKGLTYQINDLNQAVFDIKRIMYIGVGIMLTINIIPKLKELLITLGN